MILTEKLEKSRNAFIDELERCDILGLDRLNFHPGSHLVKYGKREENREEGEGSTIRGRGRQRKK